MPAAGRRVGVAVFRLDLDVESLCDSSHGVVVANADDERDDLSGPEVTREVFHRLGRDAKSGYLVREP